MVCWGKNEQHCLADATSMNQSAPAASVVGVRERGRASRRRLVSLRAHRRRHRALLGLSSHGALGNGVLQGDYTTSQEVLELTSTSLITVGWHHACAVEGPLLRCWGANDKGQLGDTADGT